MDYPISDEKYQDAVNWLFSRLPMFSRVGAPAYKPGLATTLLLDEIYYHPHRKFKAIHVAGTNGKGSTSHMLASVLQSQGYKTGLYTSPHLTDFRERMRINGEMIPREDVVKFVNHWKILSELPVTIREGKRLSPSFFELTMTMAFDWFAREKVDFAVIEVGMGGRLDSTNIINPILSVITNISFDHTQFLGDTLEKIAVEKAGIIKPGVPVVVGEAAGNVKNVFEEKAQKEGSPIIFADESPDYINISPATGGWNVKSHTGENIFVPLAGNYQKKNIRTVLCALDVLRNTGVEISEKAIVSGLEEVTVRTGLRGRWQIVSENPVVVCDTGHNIAGISETMCSLKERYTGKNIKFIIGFVSDKDVSHIVGLFPPNHETASDSGIFKSVKYYFTRASVPRAMDAGKVAEIFAMNDIDGEVCSNVSEAYRKAVNEASSEDIIYVGGSTFIVADFLVDRDFTLLYPDMTMAAQHPQNI